MTHEGLLEAEVKVIQFASEQISVKAEIQVQATINLVTLNHSNHPVHRLQRHDCDS